MGHDVFVSHSVKDKPTADAVCAVLESQGIRCWVAPRDIIPGKDWGESIVEAINGARVMVLVFSSSANNSQQIKREVERAVHKGIPVIPLRIEDVAPTASLEYFLSTPHWLDAFTPPLEKHLQYLAQIIRQIIGGPGAEVLPAPTAGQESRGKTPAAAAAKPEPPVTTGQPAAPVQPAKKTAKMIWIAAGMLVVLFAMLILILGEWFGAKPSHPGPAQPQIQAGPTAPGAEAAVRSLIGLESGQWLTPPAGFDRPTRTAMAISSDGRFLVYSAVKENPGTQDKSHLYLRRFDQLEAKPIAGTEGGSSPFLSPDDRWVGFWAERKLMKVSVEGGVPAVLCEVQVPFGFSWGADNQIVFAAGELSGLSRISDAGGKLEVLTMPDHAKGEFAHRLPFCLPAGKGILFTIMHQPWDMHPGVAVVELATRKWRVLLEDAADARYVATGHLAFLRQGTLMVVPFDLDRLEVTGQPVPAVANIAQALNISSLAYDTAAGQFSISASGSMVYAGGGIPPDSQNSLVWVDRQGKAETIAPFKAPFIAPRLSPDGQRIAYSTVGMERNAWIFDLNRGTATRLTSEGLAAWVIWTPDGQRVVFGWHKTLVRNIYWQPVDGSSPMERLTQSEYNQSPGSWSPDGKTLAFVEENPEGGYDIHLLNVRNRSVTPYLNSRFVKWYPDISPDGRWMAYASNESGRFEIYVQPFPAGGGKYQISDKGGVQPLWARNGKQLFYRSGAAGTQLNQVWSVDVQTESGFSASKPKLVFEQPGYGNGSPIRCWDISPDGERFLMVKLEERKPQPLTELVLVQNWFEELRRLAPTNK
jgi:Tol biopolymer transport system component